MEVFLFSIRLIIIKDLLLAEAKLKQTTNIEKLKDLNPLSLEYDKITVFNPYLCRVNGALLSLVFFDGLKTEFINQEVDDFVKELSEQANKLFLFGIEPNQIFMLLFNESLNQSITSTSGSDYEDRIKSTLLKIGIPSESIHKTHDTIDKSTEFDLFFRLNNKTYGIGAKRTLRERYKQFIKTAQMTPIDVMIEITLGTDLTKEKAKSITNHGVYLFISDEIYQSNAYLQELSMVYSVNSLDINLLKTLVQ